MSTGILAAKLQSAHGIVKHRRDPATGAITLASGGVGLTPGVGYGIASPHRLGYCAFDLLPNGHIVGIEQNNGGNTARRLIEYSGDVYGAPTRTLIAADTTTLKDTAGTLLAGSTAIQLARALSSGAVLFVVKDGAGKHYLYRTSTDRTTVGSGSTATDLHAVLHIGEKAGVHPIDIRALHARSFLEYQVPGSITKNILFAEYNVNGSRVNGSTNDWVRVWRSTDDGQTWAVLLEFNSDGSHRQLSHIHAIVQDPYTGLIYFCAGDAVQDGVDGRCILSWDGVSAAPAANTNPAAYAATPGWRYVCTGEPSRVGDLGFTPTHMYGLSDCLQEATDPATIGFSSIVVDKALQWVSRSNLPGRIDYLPPFILASDGVHIYCAGMISAGSAEQCIFLWASGDGGVSWRICAKFENYTATGVIQNFFYDAARGVFVLAGHAGHGIQFVSTAQATTEGVGISGSSWVFGPSTSQSGATLCNENGVVADVEIADTPTYGHWVQVLPAANNTTFTNAVNSSAAIVGIYDYIKWKELEPTEGNYATGPGSEIETRLDIAAAAGKRMCLCISDRWYNPADTPLPAYLSDIEYSYSSGGNQGIQAARWVQKWVDRMSAAMNHLNMLYRDHPAYEGLCTEETALGSYPTTGPLAYNQTAYRDALVALINNTCASRVSAKAWLWLFMNYIPEPGTAEDDAAKYVVDQAHTKRVCFGGPNAKMWPPPTPNSDYGWTNSPWERSWTGWTQHIYDKVPRPPMFAAFQPADFKSIAQDASWNQPRDLEYNFDRVINNTTDIGPSGEAGPFGWGRGTKMITWAYENSGNKFSYADALAIIEAYPRWWETRPPAFAMQTYVMDGATRLARNSTAPAVAGDKFTFFIHLKMAASSLNTTEYRVFSAQTSGGATRFAIKRSTTGAIFVQANDSAGNALINNIGSGNGTLEIADDRQCVMISGDRAQNLLLIYFGHIELYNGAWTGAAADIDFANCTQWTLGATAGGGNALLAEWAQAWFDVRFVDLRKLKLRQTVYSDVGRPLFPGVTGKRYDATDAYAQPLIYIGSPDAASVLNAGGAINRGSMTGDWTKTGGTISAGTPP